MSGMLADIRHAFRVYRGTVSSTLTAVIVLAVALAFVGAFLSLYADLVLRPHAGFEQSGRIATVGQTDGRFLLGVAHA